MAFPREFLDELISRSDIVDVVSSYVALTRKGSNYFGLCPFHNEKTGSFSVSPDKQIYHCFGCKHGGGVISFIMEIENLSFPDAVHFLAKRVNMEVPEDNTDQETARRRQRLLSLNKDAARWFYANLSTPEGAAVAQYLEQRRISRKTATNFGLGASPDSWDALITAMTKKGYTKSELLETGLAVQNKNGRLYDKFRNRLMFPVIDVRGDVVAFGGRVLDKSEPKYVNTQETIIYSKRRNLYGINLAKKSKRPNIILCEGNTDVITLHQAGFDNAVASMGTALTTEQTRLLSRFTKELILCYDNDTAGQLATQKAIALLENSEFSVRVLQLPRQLKDGEYVKQDVDDFIKHYGAEAFENSLNGSENQMDFRMDAVAAKHDLTTGEGKIAYSAEISALIASVSNAVEREVYAGRAAEKAGISREAMLLEIKRAYGKKKGAERKAMTKENLNVNAIYQPRNRSIRYDDMRSAMAEEGVLRLLFLDSSLLKECSALQEHEFSVPLLGKIYTLLCQSWQNGGSLSPAAMQEHLSIEEMSHLTTFLQKPESLAEASRSLPDYINIIRESAMRRNGVSDTDPLASAMDKSKDKKGYGGKHNG
ncbi:MAG: DNA primase [Oscillospiraceae bacterium]|nr:DNA primase [Oscillospiraceae bacterium]